MSAAFTLWRLKDEGYPDYLDGIKSQYTIATVDGRIIAYAFQEEPARLIAAAPALLECAERLAALMAPDNGRTFPTKEDCEFARAAIFLAKGESA